MSGPLALSTPTPRLQNPLIMEYTLNFIRVPTIIEGLFLNEGVLESLALNPKP